MHEHVQRCFGGPDHRRIYDPVLAGDTPREAGHRGSAKIVWNVLGAHRTKRVCQRRAVRLRETRVWLIVALCADPVVTLRGQAQSPALTSTVPPATTL